MSYSNNLKLDDIDKTSNNDTFPPLDFGFLGHSQNS